MSVAIIGHTGLVGSYLKRAFPEAAGYNSTNIEEIKNTYFNTVFCCCIPSQKWFANKNPKEDVDAIESIKSYVNTVNCKNFVLISTIDVYPDVAAGLDERSLLSHDDPAHTGAYYGKHRLILEQSLKQRCDNFYIIRLCGLFGFGLKKNIIYDFVTNPTSLVVPTVGAFQWYSLEWLAEDVKRILRQTKELTWNLFTEPLPNIILSCIFRTFNRDFAMSDELLAAEYNTTTCLAQNNTKYWRCKESVECNLRRYLHNMLECNVIVSNLALADYATRKVLHVKIGEVAPYKYFGPGFINRKDLPVGNVYSFQSLFYPNTEWNLFTDYDVVLAYLKKLVDIAVFVGAKILVFGSPKLRYVKPSLPMEEATRIAVRFFQEIADFIGERKVVICIEPNARIYGCNFLWNANQVVEFLTLVDKPVQIRLVLDVGCMLLENEDPVKMFSNHKQWLAHVHFSAAHLMELPEDNYYCWLRYYLTNVIFYKGKITIEMLKGNVEKSVLSVLKDPTINVIGGGWFGCHITSELLKRGYNPSIIEKTGLFTGVSMHNQNRLHLGFHYPRSYETRDLCYWNFKRFLSSYPGMSTPFNRNLYVVAENQSLLDFETYKLVAKYSRLKYKETMIQPEIQNCGPVGFEVAEELIDYSKVKSHFQATLSRFTEIRTCADPYSETTDMVLDCTYNSFNTLQDCTWSYTLSLIYQKNASNTDPIAITVMDGHFCSLYPLCLEKGTFTVTHVKHGLLPDGVEDPLVIQCHKQKMEEAMCEFYPDFKKLFTFEDYYVSRKCKLKSGCDSRELVINTSKNVTSFICGKITGIFDASDSILGL